MAQSNVDKEIERVLAAAKRGMEKAVTVLEADTKNLTHVVTGNLKRSWTHEVKSKNGIIEGSVGSNLKYAAAEDDYHGNLSVALNKDKEMLMDMIAAEIKSEMGR